MIEKLIIYLLIILSIHIFCNYVFNYEDFANVSNDMIIYAINLKHRYDKKKHIQNEFKKADLCGNIVEAVDGNKLDIDDLIENNIYIPQTNERRLRRGEIGCYKSHLETWQQFVLSDKKYALIFEDDAVLVADFKNKLDNLLKELEKVNFDILYLNINCDRHFGTKCKQYTTITENTMKPNIIGYGLYGYIINRKAANILIKHALPIKYPVDVYLMYNQQYNKNLNFLQVKTPLVHVKSYIDSDTLYIV